MGGLFYKHMLMLFLNNAKLIGLNIFYFNLVEYKYRHIQDIQNVNGLEWKLETYIILRLKLIDSQYFTCIYDSTIGIYHVAGNS